jgi:DNA invertase Pin-like site-specific DNA recombinase
MYRVAMRQMMGIFAELDRKSIVYKLRAARQRARANGRCEGRKPFGVREGEQAIISRMLELKAQGGNWEAISRQLNAEGLKTRTGNEWFPASVRRTVLAQAITQ